MKSRKWIYPKDVATPGPQAAAFKKQLLRISANPEDHNLPWGVIMEDCVTMYFSSLKFSGDCEAKTNWDADNYWFPRMWIEIVGVLKIDGVNAEIV